MASSIAMNHALLMCLVQCAGRLCPQRRDLFPRGNSGQTFCRNGCANRFTVVCSNAIRNHQGKVAAIHISHHEILQALIFAEIKNRNEFRMIQTRCRFRFNGKALP